MSKGNDAVYLRDTVLGAITAIATLIALIEVAGSNFRGAFWAALAVIVVATACARRKTTPLAGALLFVSLRLAVGFVLSHDIRFLAGAIATLSLTMCMGVLEQKYYGRNG